MLYKVQCFLDHCRNRCDRGYLFREGLLADASANSVDFGRRGVSMATYAARGPDGGYNGGPTGDPRRVLEGPRGGLHQYR